jgi:hypothetical protein
MTDFPLPGMGSPVVCVPAPGVGEGYWAGAPSAAVDPEGGFVVAYRLRTGHRGRGHTIVARSPDGERFETVATLEQTRFGADSMERPAIVRLDDGRWRLYVCSASRAPSKHWWIDALEADDPADFASADAVTVFPGDDRVGVKDPIVHRRAGGGWEAWICCHPLDQPGEEDRMTTAYATSDDGLRWSWHGTALEPTPGTWDARGARLTVVLPDGRCAYDGRATREENFSERTGLARRLDDQRIRRTADEPVSVARYLDVVPLPDGGYRLYYEWPLDDGSHELRTERVAG